MRPADGDVMASLPLSRFVAHRSYVRRLKTIHCPNAWRWAASRPDRLPLIKPGRNPNCFLTERKGQRAEVKQDLGENGLDERGETCRRNLATPRRCGRGRRGRTPRRRCSRGSCRRWLFFLSLLLREPALFLLRLFLPIRVDMKRGGFFG